MKETRDHHSASFIHGRLQVYDKTLLFVARIRNEAQEWTTAPFLRNQTGRASESVLQNLSEGARLNNSPQKLLRLDYSVGSALECAGCLDVAKAKELLSISECIPHKSDLTEIVRMLYGLRKKWISDQFNEEPPDYRTTKPGQFNHERLDVYKAAIEFVRWLHVLQKRVVLQRRHNRQIDDSSVSIVLNIAEGNGRYTHLDRNRFFDIAAAASVKAATILELGNPITKTATSHSPVDLATGMNLLRRISQMLKKMK